MKESSKPAGGRAQGLLHSLAGQSAERRGYALAPSPLGEEESRTALASRKLEEARRRLWPYAATRLPVTASSRRRQGSLEFTSAIRDRNFSAMGGVVHDPKA
jgi:hypothetical protein